MNELIKIKEENGQQLVSARELHEFLEIKKHLTQWLKPYIDNNNEYGFAENVDFTRIDGEVNPTNGIPIKEFVLTIEMAKELSMLSKSPKGKDARQYFITCEKKLKEVNLKGTLLLSIYHGGQEGVLASKQLVEIEVKEATKPLLDKIESDKPLVTFSEQILKSNDNILVRELAKIISDEVQKIGQNRLYDKLRDWNFLMKGTTEPYQKYIDNGYFVLEEKSINTPYGVKLSRICKVTPRGQVAIVEKFRKELAS